MTHLERLAKAYEVGGFFDYLIESYVNGNFSQVRDLAKKLKRNELVEFINYCHSVGDRYAIQTAYFLQKD